MKQFYFSASILALTAVMAVGTTIAYFSDSEVSTGNTLASGSMNLQVGSDEPSTWSFSVSGVAPGDSGEEEVLISNIGDLNGFLSMTFENLENSEQGCTEPEGPPEGSDTTCGNSGPGEGELADKLNILVYFDEDSDNSFTLGTDTQIYSGAVRGILQGDEYNYNLDKGENRDLRIEWELPGTVGNIVQTDKAGFDIVATLSQEKEDIVGDWHFNEGAGAMAYDSSGEGNHGAINGAAWTDGKYNGALDFNGIGDYADMGNSGVYDIAGALTLEGWIKQNLYPASRGNMIGKYLGPAPYRSYEIYIDNAGYAVFRIGIDGGSLQQVKSVSQIPLHEWHHITGTYDGAVMSVYIDGSLENTKAVAGSIKYDGSHVFVGMIKTGDSYFDGSIDEVKVWSRALSAAEILARYENGI